MKVIFEDSMAASRHCFRSAYTLLASLFLAALTGCGTGVRVDAPATSSVGLAGIHGQVHGGQQPVSGSRIYLYAVSTTYGGTATSLLNGPGFVLTDASGSFSITGDYSCPAGSYVYVLALGGDPGLGLPNAAIGLGSGVGLCSSLTASTFLTINEVTTVAMTSAFANLATSETQIGSPFDLSVPFTNIALISNAMSGFALTSSNTAVVPNAAINSLANSLASCVNSSGIGGACSTLFAAANVNGGGTPVDTFQAALNIAKNPVTNVGMIFNLGAANGVFQPTLAVAPASWNVAGINLNPNASCINADANTYVLSTTRGDITLELRPDLSPKNVANFLAYVNSGAYTSSIIHNLQPSFVLEGGGYKYNSSGQVTTIATTGAVVAEPGLHNLRGTLAMLGTPTSPSSQFFFNLTDNTALDTQGGGYTVIGQVVGAVGGTNPDGCFGASQGLAILDSFQQDDTIVNAGTPFTSLPVTNYSSGPIQPSNLEYVNSVAQKVNVLTTAAVPLYEYGTTDTTSNTTPVGLTDLTPGSTIYYALFYPGASAAGESDYYQQAAYVPYTGPISLPSNVVLDAYASAPNLPNRSLSNDIGFNLVTGGLPIVLKYK